MALEHIGPVHDLFQGQQQLSHVHIRLGLFPGKFRAFGFCRKDVPFQARQLIDVFCCLLEALVFLQTANQLCTRIVFFVFLVLFLARQQHARLDLAQHGGHHQIFRRQLEVHRLHQLHVLHVLSRDGGDRNVENVQILSLDQVQQQIQRALKGFQEDLQGVGRYIQIVRQFGDRLAIHQAKGHLCLAGMQRLHNGCDCGFCRFSHLSLPSALVRLSGN